MRGRVSRSVTLAIGNLSSRLTWLIRVRHVQPRLHRWSGANPVADPRNFKITFDSGEGCREQRRPHLNREAHSVLVFIFRVVVAL
jgi:hypothetical protein